ncbi:hypothetical protein C8J57DRAFT_1232699 [Mycena rebaudengoi]|nr:hypothetical protein C8J57DRAFT_1232699 [Mycena rebaudengoi]
MCRAVQGQYKAAESGRRNFGIQHYGTECGALAPVAPATWITKSSVTSIPHTNTVPSDSECKHTSKHLVWPCKEAAELREEIQRLQQKLERLDESKFKLRSTGLSTNDSSSYERAVTGLRFSGFWLGFGRSFQI